ncbi:hypothetical protein [Mycobacterium intracellulare]|uniref:hypothetical protein n=1 Tax=Mycobacterium intracellulare TaxID=1767 RepID=UPI0019284774|nr:hypothetical protein [Mycobacterium intracellulare]
MTVGMVTVGPVPGLDVTMRVLRPAHGLVAEVDGCVFVAWFAGECWALVVACSVAAFAVAWAVE